MNNLVKILSSALDEARRVIKFKRYGNQDVQTSWQVSPYGMDSNPIKDMVAVYAETGEKGETTIIGYINKNQVAAVGETRLFSTDAQGVLKSYAWLKNDGTIEFNGAVNNLVRYTPLNAGLEAQAQLINIELAKIAVVLNSLIPSSYTPVPIEIDISDSKIDELKTL